LKPIKCRLIEVEDINVYYRTGDYDPTDGLVRERKGFLGLRKDQKYTVNSKHIKRSKSGRMVIFIDLKGRKSINPHGSQSRDGEQRNYLKYLTEGSFWEKFGRGELDTKTLLIVMMAGAGFAFLLERIFMALGFIIG